MTLRSDNKVYTFPGKANVTTPALADYPISTSHPPLTHPSPLQVNSMDIYLPLLTSTSPQTSTSIAQLLAAAVRTQPHRRAVTEWLPPGERLREVKTRRGWEKAATTAGGAGARSGGWAAGNLAALLKSRDVKVRASLSFSLSLLWPASHGADADTGLASTAAATRGRAICARGPRKRKLGRRVRAREAVSGPGKCGLFSPYSPPPPFFVRHGLTRRRSELQCPRRWRRCSRCQSREWRTCSLRRVCGGCIIHKCAHTQTPTTLYYFFLPARRTSSARGSRRSPSRTTTPPC